MDPTCFRCGKAPKDLDEYVDNPDQDPDPVRYVIENEGTYNPKTHRFACTLCYVVIGMPSAPHGWKAP